MSYRQLIDQHTRLTILQLLAQARGYDLNSAILHSALAQVGHTTSSDVLDTHLAWLAEQGLVTLQAVGHLQVATLTQRGLDIAEDRADVPGVARPGPGV